MGEGKNLPRCSNVNDVTIQNRLSLISSIRIPRFDIIIVDPALILLYLAAQPSESIIEPDKKAAIIRLVIGNLRKIAAAGHALKR